MLPKKRDKGVGPIERLPFPQTFSTKSSKNIKNSGNKVGAAQVLYPDQIARQHDYIRRTLASPKKKKSKNVTNRGSSSSVRRDVRDDVIEEGDEEEEGEEEQKSPIHQEEGEEEYEDEEEYEEDYENEDGGEGVVGGDEVGREEELMSTTSTKNISKSKAKASSLRLFMSATDMQKLIQKTDEEISKATNEHSNILSQLSVFIIMFG